MALRLANDDSNKPSGQAKEPERNPWDPPAGNKEPERNPWDPPVGDYGQQNDWNTGLERQTIHISQTVSPDDFTVEKRSGQGDNAIIKISGIILYIFYIVFIGCMIWLASQDPLLIQDNESIIKSISSIMVIYIIIDAFLVFFLYEKRVSLLVFAFLLYPFYPIRRNKVIRGSSGTGALLTLGYFVAFIAVVVGIYNGYLNYGGIINADSTTRQESKMLLDQTTRTGKTYSSAMKQYLEIKNAELQEHDGITYLVIVGYGSISIDDSNTYVVGAKTVPTTLVFEKDTSSGQYKICAVEAGKKQFTEYGAISYWSIYEGN